jgi:hypothetical protein
MAHAQSLQQAAILAAAVTPAAPSADTKHGGPATQQMPISKRQEDETGGVANAPNAGAGRLQ